MRVLVSLAERRGEVVSVDQLLDLVWKDLVVTPYSVYQAVAALRRALGDDPKDPTYIANVVRRGYRLIAPVEADAKTQEEVRLAPEPATEADLDEQQVAVNGELRQVIPGTADTSPALTLVSGLRYGALLVVLLVLAGGVWWFLLRSGKEQPATGQVRAAVTTSPIDTTSTAFTPPSHSVAVLPFTNLSGDPKQEYFSDGMTEELINALAQIDALKVTARTSSFSFKGKDADIGTIRRKLNVAAILEGSVRRSGNRVRITAQLVNAVSGFHIWSQDYDRDLSNVLVLQTEIATAVARELQAKLLGDEAPKIELGGTRNPAAFDAYLRGLKAYSSNPDDAKVLQIAIAAYSEAIRLDPTYALAFAGRSVALTDYSMEYTTGPAIRVGFDAAQTDARRALALAPALAEGHMALARLLDTGFFEFTQASKAHERALALAPGNAEVLRQNGAFAVRVGNVDAGLTDARSALVLDPLNPRSYSLLGQALYFARRYGEAVAAFAEVIRLDPNNKLAFGFRGLAYYGLGDLRNARSSCESKPDQWTTQWCLAVTYDKLGQHADAEALLAKMMAAYGDAAAYQYATIYAQWGSGAKSLEWLDKALRARDPGMTYLKTDPLMDPVREEPRFQAIKQELKFPD
jgi:TolB-like protein/DNA-binding winged helix-turn-helix (wHTH) protein/Tfp pilus assembly protein PilF